MEQPQVTRQISLKTVFLCYIRVMSILFGHKPLNSTHSTSSNSKKKCYPILLSILSHIINSLSYFISLQTIL